MKKRILSVLLATVMVLAVFVVPTSAAGSNKTTSTAYTFDFEDVDIRNYVDGQVFDLGWKEAAKAPTMTGNVDEYTVSGMFIKNLDNADAGTTPAVLPTYLSVKDGYLYVAFLALGESGRQPLQYDIGVGSAPEGETAYNRTGRIPVSATGEITDSAPLIWVPGTGTQMNGNANIDGDLLLSGVAYNDGIYEAKFNLFELYRITSGLGNGMGVYQTPVVTFAIWYNGVHYAMDIPDGNPCGAGRQIKWVPYSIIIPKETFALINATKSVMGELGKDYRNLVEGQLVVLKDYATTLPTVDGKITSDSEYQVYKDYSGSTEGAKGNGDFRIYYSVGNNGLIYVGLKYKEAVHGNVITQYGLSCNAGFSMYSRNGVTLKTDGTRASQGNFWFTPAKRDGYSTSTYFGSTNANNYISVTAQATTHDAASTETVYEYSVSIAQMVASYEDMGNPADICNGFVQEILLHMGTAAAATGAWSYRGITSAEKAVLNAMNGHTYTCNWVLPTLQIPDDAIERFRIDEINDLGGYGQKHLTAVKSTAKLDGVINSGEYTASYDFVNGTATGTNYFTADDEYVYYAAKVVDPGFQLNKSHYQYDIAVVPDNDVVDTGHAYTRIGSTYTFTKADALEVFNVVPGVTYRAQNNYAGGNTDEVAMKARVNERASDFKAVGYYDSASQTTYYEWSVKKSALAYAFQCPEDQVIDQILYFNYLYSQGNFTYLQPGAVANTTLARLTMADNGGACPYGTGWYPIAVVDFVDAGTKNSASVRLSTTTSGLRFKSTYSNAYLEQIAKIAEADGKTIEVGTLIAPADYITGEFTHAALGTGKYVEVMADLDTPFSNVNGLTTIAGSLVNIKEGNLGREFAGRGFIKVGDKYFYSDTYAVKSVSEVASAAVADTAKAQGNGYNYEISAGVWSPYTAGQREVLNSLIAK